jgi:hypothetical protein
MGYWYEENLNTKESPSSPDPFVFGEISAQTTPCLSPVSPYTTIIPTKEERQTILSSIASPSRAGMFLGSGLGRQAMYGEDSEWS